MWKSTRVIVRAQIFISVRYKSYDPSLKARSFIDRARIRVRGGDGGHGCISFRRERRVPNGGPDGGDGGQGGHVILRTDANYQDLSHLQHVFRGERGGNGYGHNANKYDNSDICRILSSEGSMCFGKAGADVEIPVPLGTVVREIVLKGQEQDDVETDEQTLQQLKEHTCDLGTTAGTSVLVARGGRGGTFFFPLSYVIRDAYTVMRVRMCMCLFAGLGNAHFVNSVRQSVHASAKRAPGEERMLELETQNDRGCRIRRLSECG